MVAVPDSEAPMQDTGVYIAITGNGRNSRAHAEFIAAAPELLAAAMAEIERQREEFGDLDAMRDQGGEAPCS
jgi:hypothetical protein